MKKKAIILLVFLAQLSGFAQNYKFGKVSKEEIQEQFYPLDSTADAAYLYKYRWSYFDYSANNGFQLVTEIHHRIKIYTPKGFDYATKSIQYYTPGSSGSETVSRIKGYTFYIDNGKLVKEKLSKKGIFKEEINEDYSKVKITMPMVKEGCVLEIRYRLTSPYATSISDVQFQKGIPIKKLESRIEFPEYYKFNKRSKGFYNIPMKTLSKTSVIGDLNYRTDILLFEGNNVPALKNDEPYVANIYNYRGGVKFELSRRDFIGIGGKLTNYSTSWENVSKKIYESSSFGGELKKSNYYKKDLEKILAENKTDVDKISTIFSFVKNKVKWNGYYGKYSPKGLKKAYKNNVGNVADINLMLTAMLRSAGLNADPVLISSRGNGVPLFPTLNGFDYVISAVQFPDNSYVLLDATEKYSIPNILPARVLNWNGRIVTKAGTSSWIKLSSSKQASEENMVMIKISDDLMIDGFIRTKYNNLNALNFRKNNNHLKDDELITKYEENNNIEIEDFKIINQEKLNKPVIRNVKFSSEDLIEQIGNKLYVEPTLFLTKRKNPFKLDERKFPVDFTSAWKEINRVSIQIPEGYIVEKLPEPLAIGLPDNLGVYKYQVTQSANKLKAISILQFNSSIIPAQYYQELKGFYSQLVKKETEKIVFVKQ